GPGRGQRDPEGGLIAARRFSSPKTAKPRRSPPPARPQVVGTSPVPSPEGRRWSEGPDEGLLRLAGDPPLSCAALSCWPREPHPALRATFSFQEKVTFLAPARARKPPEICGTSGRGALTLQLWLRLQHLNC